MKVELESQRSPQIISRFAATSMLSRLKTPSVVLGGGGGGTPGSSGGSSTGGMRKLSSSPHLLGICEEGEEESGEWNYSDRCNF